MGASKRDDPKGGGTGVEFNCLPAVLVNTTARNYEPVELGSIQAL